MQLGANAVAEFLDWNHALVFSSGHINLDEIISFIAPRAPNGLA